MHTSFKRADRVGEVIHRGLCDIILRQLDDPLIKAVNITGVRLSPDLRVARVYVSSLSREFGSEEVLAHLKKARKFIRGELGRRLRLRYTPELVFRWDDSVSYSLHIKEVIDKLKDEGPNFSGEED